MNPEKFVGCEVEILKTREGIQLLDLNAGTVGGAALITSFAANESPAMAEAIRKIAETRVENNGDLFVSGIGAYTTLNVNGRVRLAPLIQEIERVAQDQGQRVKGVLSREGTFPKDAKNWRLVKYDAEGNIKDIAFNADAIEELAGTPVFCMNGSFAPACKDTVWSDQTRRNGLVNHILNLPSMQALVLGNLGDNSPYSKTIFFSTCNRGKDIHLQGVDAAKSYQELGDRLRALNCEVIAVKDAGGITIGGRGVEFLRMDTPPTRNFPSLEWRISSPAVVTPYAFPIATDTERGPAVIQTRINCIPGKEGLVPVLLSAKMYFGQDTEKPMNTSSYCPEVVAWDLKDRLAIFTFPERGECRLSSTPASETPKLVGFFEGIMEESLPLLSKVEDSLQESFGSYDSAKSSCEDANKKGLLPASARQWINLFRYSAKKTHRSVEEWQMQQI